MHVYLFMCFRVKRLEIEIQVLEFYEKYIQVIYVNFNIYK